MLYTEQANGGYSGTSISYTATQNCIAIGMAVAIDDGKDRSSNTSVTSSGKSLTNNYYYLEKGQTINVSASLSGGANSKTIVFLTVFALN